MRTTHVAAVEGKKRSGRKWAARGEPGNMQLAETNRIFGGDSE